MVMLRECPAGSDLDRPGLRRAERLHEISVSPTLDIEGALVETVASCDLTRTEYKELGWYTWLNEALRDRPLTYTRYGAIEG